MRHGWPVRIVTLVVLVCFIFFSGCSRYYAASPHDLTVEDLAWFSSKVRFLSGDADAHFRMARHFQERGRHRFAVAELKKALQIDPANALALNALGISLDMLGDYELAEESFKMAIEAAPDMEDAHNNLGYCYLLQNRIQEAISAFEKAIELNDRVPRYRNNLALAYVKADLPNLAFEEFKRAGGPENARMKMAKLAPSFGREHMTTPLPSSSLPAEIQGENSETVQIAPEEIRDYEKSLLENDTTVRKIPVVQTPVRSGKPFAVVQDQKDKFIKINAFELMKEHAPSSGSAKSDEAVEKIESVPSEPDLTEQETPNAPFFASLENDQLPALGYPEARKPQTSEKSGVPVAVRKFEIQNRTDRGKKELIAQSLSKLLGIEVSNGNGINGMARRVGNYLKSNGLSVIRLTNADHFGHSETIIFYTAGLFHEAYRVAREIPGYQDLKEVDGFDRSNIGIRVLIGRDIIPTRRIFEQQVR